MNIPFNLKGVCVCVCVCVTFSSKLFHPSIPPVQEMHGIKLGGIVQESCTIDSDGWWLDSNQTSEWLISTIDHYSATSSQPQNIVISFVFVHVCNIARVPSSKTETFFNVLFFKTWFSWCMSYAGSNLESHTKSTTTSRKFNSSPLKSYIASQQEKNVF